MVANRGAKKAARKSATPTNKKRLRPHPYAKFFPEMSPDEFTHLVADIRRHGLREPIYLYQGKILDGWHRYRAALKAGVTPKFRQHRGGDPLEFAVSMNVMRRHLNQGQQALLLVTAKEQAGQLARRGTIGRGRTRTALGTLLRTNAELAKLIGVAESTVKRARRVMDRPGLAKKVLAGECSLDQADAQLRRRPWGARHRGLQPSWKGRADVARTMQLVRQWQTALPDIMRGIRTGDYGLDAKLYLAIRLRLHIESVAEFADWLEEGQEATLAALEWLE